jgi:hypothetical protein
MRIGAAKWGIKSATDQETTLPDMGEMLDEALTA